MMMMYSLQSTPSPLSLPSSADNAIARYMLSSIRPSVHPPVRPGGSVKDGWS